MKQMLKLGLTLALYAAAACTGLALVYTATKERIDGHARRNLEAALLELFPEAEKGGFEELPSPSPAKAGAGDIVIKGQYRVLRGGETLGLAIEAQGPGYGGPITILAGLKREGTVAGVKILDHGETPGLGANAASPSYYVDKKNKITFYGQFAGKPLSAPFEVGNGVEAVTASTITSRGVSSLVKAAALAAGAWFAEEGR